MTGDFGECMDQKLLKDIKKFLDEHLEVKVFESVSFDKMAIPAASYKRMVAEDLGDYINKKQTMGFQKRLFKYIDRKGMTDPEVYKGAGIDKRLFSKIRSNENYHPSKETVFALCLALELELEESEDLMEEAGYAFSNSERFDLIVKYHIINELYDIVQLNIVLDEFGEKLLGKF